MTIVPTNSGLSSPPIDSFLKGCPEMKPVLKPIQRISKAWLHLYLNLDLMVSYQQPVTHKKRKDHVVAEKTQIDIRPTKEFDLRANSSITPEVLSDFLAKKIVPFQKGDGLYQVNWTNGSTPPEPYLLALAEKVTAAGIYFEPKVDKTKLTRPEFATSLSSLVGL